MATHNDATMRLQSFIVYENTTAGNGAKVCTNDSETIMKEHLSQPPASLSFINTDNTFWQFFCSVSVTLSTKKHTQ